MCQKDKQAFTLAEVLITLGIIVVVAAMTMPSLIQSYKKQEATARLKKFSSMMSQAIIMSEMENGDISEWSQAGANQSAATKNFFMTYLSKYIKYTTIKENNEISEIGVTVYLPDSSSFNFYKGGCIDFRFDINGDRKPNIFGRDKFVFLACPQSDTSFCNGNGGWCTYHQKHQTTRTSRLEQCKQNALYCSSLLEYDNWEFKSDYPYRL